MPHTLDQTAARLVLALVGTLAACSRSPDLQSAVEHWLVCEDCVEELDAVVARGDAAVGGLRLALRNGPTQQQMDNIGQQASTSYDAILRVGGSPPPNQPSRADYMRLAVENFKATYQSRAAVALGRIGTPTALTTLTAALRNDTSYRPDVRAEIAVALGATLGLVSGEGQTQVGGSPPANPIVLSVRDAASLPISAVPLRFAIEAGFGQLTDTLLPTSPSGIVEQTTWRLGPFGTNTLIAVAAGRAMRVTATATEYPSVTFTATLAGVNEVPPVTTLASGNATVASNPATAVITVTLNVSGLSAAPTTAHIHSGVVGSNGPVRMNLCGAGTAPACPATTSAVIVGAIGPSLAADSLLTFMRRLGAYVDVHTAAHPAGEIRSQIVGNIP